MASPPGQPPPLHYEPVGRFAHCSTLISGKYYTYGGNFGTGESPPLSLVEILDLGTEKWQQIPTLGERPPGHLGASCVVIGVGLFHFGGDGESGFCNTIHCLDTINLAWRAIPATNPQGAPMPKSYAGMLVYENTFVISGGYGDLQDHHLPGREHVPDPDDEGCGWTNELHCFHVDSSELC